MVKSVEGVFRKGKIELLGPAPTAAETRVVVTFFTDPKQVDLAERGIGPEDAAALRSRLKTFEEDWDRPDMDAYDAV